MKKVYPNAKAALEGIARDNMMVMCGGFGLVGMRERVESLGGTLEIAPIPGSGTRVSARLPVQRRSADPTPA